MPTLLTEKGYRFWFGSRGESTEPPHVHVTQGRRTCKFWLDPIEVARIGSFRSHELRRIEKIIYAHQAKFLEDWNEFFG